MTASAGVLREHWEMVVSLEWFAPLRTRTKAFCACSTDQASAPNVNSCPVCLALPGALPVLNAHAIELAARAALALECTVQPMSVFVREHRASPAWPKGYRLTQEDQPLAKDGRLQIGMRADGSPIRVCVSRVYLTEDSARVEQDHFDDASALDFNRAGLPILGIVSAPELYASEQAIAYVRVLAQMLDHMLVTDSADEIEMRCHASISVRRRSETSVGTRVVIRNLDSVSALEHALDTEFARQVELVERGGKVAAESAQWDASLQDVRARTALPECPHDRSLPDPDLPPLILSQTWIAKMRKDVPELPRTRCERFVSELGLTAHDADVLSGDPRLADYFEAVARGHRDARVAAKWVSGKVIPELRAQGIPVSRFRVRPADLAQLLDMLRDGMITESDAERIWERMLSTGKRALEIAERANMLLESEPAQVPAAE